MFRCCRRRWTLRATSLFMICWLFVILYLYYVLDGTGIPWSHRSQYNAVLKQVMSAEPSLVQNRSLQVPLSDLILPRFHTLSFYQLPRRRPGYLYTEVTSANRDTSYPLAPDFTFHLEYHDDHVVLYQDYGPACVHRIYLFPSLPTHADLLYKMTAQDLKDSHISFSIDYKTFRYSLEQFMMGEKWPFLSPFNTQHKYLASGMGSYMSICYENSLTISYIPKEKLPDNLLETTINCSRDDSFCPVHIYSSISRVKFPTNFQVESFSSGEATYKARASRTAALLRQPEINGPGYDPHQCKLECIEICRNCKRILFSYRGPGVISSILMRVFETSNGELRQDWMDVLLSVSFDGDHPSIDKVPLGAFFGVTASLNQFSGATFGKKKRQCFYDDPLLGLSTEEITGYFYFPMPFWRGAKITLDGSEFIDVPLLACFSVDVVENYYEASQTGYFHARKTYFDSNVSGYRELLSVGGSWGQVVGVMMEVDNLRVVRDVPVNERWPALQADAVLYLDGAKAASVLGTGLEDYFSYAHGFNMAENTTYAFVGNYHASPRRKEPLTWHCYRLHILDPIYFSDSIQFIMEGTSREIFQTEHPSLTYQDYMKRRIAGESCLSHTVYYYMGLSTGVTTTDSFHLAQSISEIEHHFEIIKTPSRKSGELFKLLKKRYLGASNRNETFNIDGRVFLPGTKFTFTMMCLQQNQGIILRREFYSMPRKSWNELAKVWVDDAYLGQWAIPMGSTSEEYSIRQEDFSISKRHTNNKNILVFTIQTLTWWRDMSYRVMSIH